MNLRTIFVGDIEAIAIEGSPLGSICVAPVVLGEAAEITAEEHKLVRKKAALLRKLLTDEDFILAVEQLYGEEVHFPPMMVSFRKSVDITSRS